VSLIPFKVGWELTGERKKWTLSGDDCDVQAGVLVMIMGGNDIEFAYRRTSEFIDISKSLTWLIDECDDDDVRSDRLVLLTCFLSMIILVWLSSDSVSDFGIIRFLLWCCWWVNCGGSCIVSQTLTESGSW